MGKEIRFGVCLEEMSAFFFRVGCDWRCCVFVQVTDSVAVPSAQELATRGAPSVKETHRSLTLQCREGERDLIRLTSDSLRETVTKTDVKKVLSQNKGALTMSAGRSVLDPRPKKDNESCALCLSVCLSVCLSHTQTNSHTHTHTHTLSLSLSLTHTHTHTLSLSVSLSLTHTHTSQLGYSTPWHVCSYHVSP